MNNELVTFETGKTYGANAIGDQNCVFTFVVVKRTEKTLTLRNPDGIKRGTFNVKLSNDGISETCMPLGRYSMAPTLRATRVLATA